MSTLVIVGYNDPYQAEKVRFKLRKLQSEYLLDLVLLRLRVVVRVLCLVVFGILQGSATLTEPTLTPQSPTR